MEEKLAPHHSVSEGKCAIRESVDERFDPAGSIAGRFTFDELFDQKLRESNGIVTHDAVLLQQIIEQAAHAHTLHVANIHANGLGSARTISARDFR